MLVPKPEYARAFKENAHMFILATRGAEVCLLVWPREEHFRSFFFPIDIIVRYWRRK